ncbi:MAG TPA: hypothetical protein VFF81_06340 [Noviherbaspirillum sp.]|nr:hypothetical protein [Noviherbaspirillum sp.]
MDSGMDTCGACFSRCFKGIQLAADRRHVLLPVRIEYTMGACWLFSMAAFTNNQRPDVAALVM